MRVQGLGPRISGQGFKNLGFGVGGLHAYGFGFQLEGCEGCGGVKAREEQGFEHVVEEQGFGIARVMS